MIGEMEIANTAAHLTCVGAPKAEVDAVIDEFLACGVRHFVALRGDPQGGIGSVYEPFPGGYENAAALVKALRARGDFEISVSAYPEKHPESPDVAADIDMLKRKVDNGATRALTQFFFDNDDFERYLERVRRAGIAIRSYPGYCRSIISPRCRNLPVFAAPEFRSRSFRGWALLTISRRSASGRRPISRPNRSPISSGAASAIFTSTR